MCLRNTHTYLRTSLISLFSTQACASDRLSLERDRCAADAGGSLTYRGEMSCEIRKCIMHQSCVDAMPSIYERYAGCAVSLWNKMGEGLVGG